MVQHEDCILGALFIESDYIKKEFQTALAVNRKKIEFLSRVSDRTRYAYLKNYTGAWWNLRNNSRNEWHSRFEKLENIRVRQLGQTYEHEFYFPIEEEEEEEEEEKQEEKKMKKR
jgi:hypothetical protein